MTRSKTTLTTREITKLCQKYPGWQLQNRGKYLCKTFKTQNYIEGLVMLARITVHAEILQHHPDVTVSYGEVKIKTTTHDTKSLTKRDELLIARIEHSLKESA